jgi:CO/xanthine dehydrogenase Mo-binding subunit
MGQSRALYEELIFDEMGSVANPNLSFYYVARSADMPDEWVLKIIETPQSDGPYGARGIGENVMIAVAPAIGNALYHGLGVDVRSLPMKAERVWKAIREQNPELYRKALEELKRSIRESYERLAKALVVAR